MNINDNAARSGYTAPSLEEICLEEETAMLAVSPAGGTEGFGEEDGQW